MRSIFFKDFVTLQRGFDLPAHSRIDGQYPIIASTSITGYHNEFKVLPPGVVTGRSGALGEVQYVDVPFWPLNTSLWVKDFKENWPRYVYYLLKTLDLKRFNSGAGVPTLNRNDLDTLEVRVHDEGDQRRIASILSQFDDLIENNTRRIAILEEIARRLYEAWFVYFHFPGYEKVHMVESELGLIPKGWEIATVGECSIVHRGKSYKSSELADDGGLPFVNLKCMERDGGFRKSGLKGYIGTYKETHKVKVGDLVMAVTDMTQERRIVARCGRIPRLDADFGVISMDLVKLEPRPLVPRDYLYGMFRWSSFADEVKQHANGANVLHLLPDRISDYKFAKPDKSLMDRFATTIAPMLQQQDVLGEKIIKLRTQRDLLLPKLITGEIDVSAFSDPEVVAT